METILIQRPSPDPTKPDERTPLRPEDIIFVEITACPAPPTTPGAVPTTTTTPSPPAPTTTPKDCMFELTPEDIDPENPSKPKTFPDDTKIKVINGEIRIIFPDPKDVNDVTVQTPDGKPLEVIPVRDNNREDPIPIDSNTPTDETGEPQEPKENPVDLPQVEKIIIRDPSGDPIDEPEDFTFIEVTACPSEATTTPAPQVTTTTPTPTTTEPEDCMFPVNPEDLPKTLPGPNGPEVSTTPEGNIVYEFPTPVDVTVIRVTSDSEEPIEVVLVPEDDNKPRQTVPANPGSTGEEPGETTLPEPVPEVKRVIVKQPEVPTDPSEPTPTIEFVEITACPSEPEVTTPAPQPTTTQEGVTLPTPTPPAPTTPEVCYYQLTEVPKAPINLPEAVITEDQGDILYTFPEDRYISTFGPDLASDRNSDAMFPALSRKWCLI